MTCSWYLDALTLIWTVDSVFVANFKAGLRWYRVLQETEVNLVACVGQICHPKLCFCIFFNFGHQFSSLCFLCKTSLFTQTFPFRNLILINMDSSLSRASNTLTLPTAPKQPHSARWPVWSWVRSGSQGHLVGCPICPSHMKTPKLNRRWCFQWEGWLRHSARGGKTKEKGCGLRRQTVIYRSVSLSVRPTLGSFALIAGLGTREWGPPSADNSPYPLKM